MERCEKGHICFWCNKEATWVEKYEIRIDGKTYLQEDYICSQHKAANTRWLNKFKKKHEKEE